MLRFRLPFVRRSRLDAALREAATAREDIDRLARHAACMTSKLGEAEARARKAGDDVERLKCRRDTDASLVAAQYIEIDRLTRRLDAFRGLREWIEANIPKHEGA